MYRSPLLAEEHLPPFSPFDLLVDFGQPGPASARSGALAAPDDDSGQL